MKKQKGPKHADFAHFETIIAYFESRDAMPCAPVVRGIVTMTLTKK